MVPEAMSGISVSHNFLLPCGASTHIVRFIETQFPAKPSKLLIALAGSSLLLPKQKKSVRELLLPFFEVYFGSFHC